MKPNLVIVESPAKAKTIEKFLGKDYKVLSSYGHIRDLKKKSFSIDIDSFEPQYEVPEDKTKLVTDLKKLAKEAETVWLASDEDREGEAISWHLYEVLRLKPENTRRIVFHEITKPAILEAIKNPRAIDLNLVNAQQARRVLDRIVGFKLSPVLWRKVKPALSAGRVQSVAVRLIVEREREVNAFHGSDYYRVTAIFTNTSSGAEVKAELNQRFSSKADAQAFLAKCKDATFTIADTDTKPQKRMPAPPFTTSTLQQDAAHKLGFTVAQTMSVAQRLYESGRITYMRTDSVNLSSLCLGTSKTYIAANMGKEYVHTRQFHTSAKGAQEAHEAIRPTYMDCTEIEGTLQERRLYNLIWKRTIASQMAEAEIEKTTVNISISGMKEMFIATGEVVKFDGFLRVYKGNESDNYAENDGDNDNDNTDTMLPPMKVGDTLLREEIVATQRYTQRPVRYNEASLVHKLEELGIGRPSTYATTITTIQQREYVQKGSKEGEVFPYAIVSLKGDSIKESEKKITLGAERGKLLPTDTGIVVNDFLLENFPEILDYNFTADVEKEFDDIAEGKKEWATMIRKFYKDFSPLVEKAANSKTEHRVGERVLGIDPASGSEVTVKIGRFGPVVQIGNAEDEKKPRFAQLKESQSLETITLEEALELFRLPRTLGEYGSAIVTIGAGRFGPYVQYNRKYVSIPKSMDPLTITLDEAIELIKEQEKAEAERHLKKFEEAPDMEVLNGRYGPYIAYKGNNYRLPKNLHERAIELTLEECMQIIEAQGDKTDKAAGKGKKRFSKKKA